jgi:hypothetical protein
MTAAEAKRKMFVMDLSTPVATDLRINGIHISLLQVCAVLLAYIPHTFVSVVQFLYPLLPRSVSSFITWKLDELVLMNVRKCGGIGKQTDGIISLLLGLKLRQCLEQVVVVCKKVVIDRTLKSKLRRSINTD